MKKSNLFGFRQRTKVSVVLLLKLFLKILFVDACNAHTPQMFDYVRK